jgi:Ca2+-binding EF-hand superfamily protein
MDAKKDVRADQTYSNLVDVIAIGQAKSWWYKIFDMDGIGRITIKVLRSVLN